MFVFTKTQWMFARHLGLLPPNLKPPLIRASSTGVIISSAPFVMGWLIFKAFSSPHKTQRSGKRATLLIFCLRVAKKKAVVSVSAFVSLSSFRVGGLSQVSSKNKWAWNLIRRALIRHLGSGIVSRSVYLWNTVTACLRRRGASFSLSPFLSVLPLRTGNL